MVVHITLLALVSLGLFFDLAAGAAIPSSHLQPEHEKSFSNPIEAASWPPRLDESGNNEALAKRTPYYFPETVPDAEEIASRLTALREAGLVAQTQKSMGVPDAGIDPRILLIRDLLSEEMSTPMLLPPMAFFILAVSAVCVATVFRKVKCKH